MFPLLPGMSMHDFFLAPGNKTTTNYRRRRRDRQRSLLSEQEAITKATKGVTGDNDNEQSTAEMQNGLSHSDSQSSIGSSTFEPSGSNDVTAKSSSGHVLPAGRRRVSRQDTNPSLLNTSSDTSNSDMVSPRRRKYGGANSAVFPKPFSSSSTQPELDNSHTGNMTNGNSIPSGLHVTNDSQEESTNTSSSTGISNNNNYIVQSSESGSFNRNDARFQGSQEYRKQPSLGELSRQTSRSDVFENENEDSKSQRLGYINMYNSNEKSLPQQQDSVDGEMTHKWGTRTFYPAKTRTDFKSSQPDSTIPSNDNHKTTTSITLQKTDVTDNTCVNDPQNRVILGKDTVAFSKNDGDTISLASTVSTLSSGSVATTDSINDSGVGGIKRQSMGSLSDLEHRDLDLASEGETQNWIYLFFFY